MYRTVLLSAALAWICVKAIKNEEAHAVLIHPGNRPKNDPIENHEDIKGFDQKGYRNAAADSSVRWPNGRIPYKFGRSIDSRAKSAITQAMADYKEYSCLKWEPAKSADRDYIEFIKEKGCWSYVGRNGGKQEISIGGGCEYKGITIHEMMHSVGFYHEQSRSDRDEFISVNYNNIANGLDDQFEKLSVNEENQLGEPYDYLSIMHYGKTSFSKRYPLPTITPKDPKAKIGQREGFSSVDLFKINKLYRCPDSYNQKIRDIVARSAVPAPAPAVPAPPPAPAPAPAPPPASAPQPPPPPPPPSCSDYYSQRYCQSRRNRGCRRSRTTRFRCQKTCRVC